MSFPDLKTRSVVKPGTYAVIPPEGRVINVIPGIEGCELSIVGSPKIGCSFVQYVGKVKAEGQTTKPFAAESGIESFIYVIDGEGELKVTIGGESKTLSAGGYAYIPDNKALEFANTGRDEVRILLYKQRYIPAEGMQPYTVFGNVHDIQEDNYMGLPQVWIKDLLPVDINFDMNFHVLSFDPGGCHPFIETHVQEHGAYLLEGEGIYLLGQDWVQTVAEDFIWFGPFTQQACYGTGDSRFTYIYSKDCHRDVEI
ncbi:(S)-ureidoglycine aminohydrolase [Endozoicomonas sp. Mp262]|uniref:(S)-ureidoglycine aminohydrolase n=1 Tax=Endozoicomonas sp. Mp262 TaxID=2919499 RepID=UPI0021D8EA1D